MKTTKLLGGLVVTATIALLAACGSPGNHSEEGATEDAGGDGATDVAAGGDDGRSTRVDAMSADASSGAKDGTASSDAPVDSNLHDSASEDGTLPDVGSDSAMHVDGGSEVDADGAMPALDATQPTSDGPVEAATDSAVRDAPEVEGSDASPAQDGTPQETGGGDAGADASLGDASGAVDAAADASLADASGAADAADASPGCSCPVGTPCAIYVSPSGSDAATGQSWTSAKATPQAGINAAAAAGLCEVWVATGTYALGAVRTDTLTLARGVTVYGGFAGTETTLAARNITANPTTFAAWVGSPSAHVLVHAVTTADGSGVDGVTINGANGAAIDCMAGSFGLANATITGSTGGLEMDTGCAQVRVQSSTFTNTLPTGPGAAIYQSGGTLSISGSTFSNNYAYQAGGAIWTAGTLSVTSSTFTSNTAGSTGGAIYGNGSSVISVAASTFQENLSNEGGAIYAGNSLTVKTSTFTHNYTEPNTVGGAISIHSATGVVVNTIFQTNVAGSNGGAFYVDPFSTLEVDGCRFNGNEAGESGGAIYAAGPLRVALSTFWGSEAACQIPMYCSGGAIYAGNLTLTNSIFDTNIALAAPGPNIAASAVAEAYNDLHGDGITTNGNIDADPLFADLNPIPPDLTLRGASPCINTGGNGLIPADVLDVDGNGNTTEPLPLDLAGNPRIQHNTVDRGCYESSR
jgi:predicted outer membrane repeat protein